MVKALILFQWIKINGSGGAWYELETSWKNALESNKEVKVNIQPIYSETNKRPTSFIIEQNVDGKQLSPLRLNNSATGK